jgi:hypothetical protein
MHVVGLIYCAVCYVFFYVVFELPLEWIKFNLFFYFVDAIHSINQ